MKTRNFFVSYAAENESRAQWIVDTLEAAGYSVYYQKRDILPGDDFLDKMNDFLQYSKRFLALWSGEYANAPYCMNEWKAAYRKNSRDASYTLLIVETENQTVPPLYDGFVRFKLCADDEQNKQALINAVKGFSPPPPPTPPRSKGRVATAVVTALILALFAYWLAAGRPDGLTESPSSAVEPPTTDAQPVETPELSADELYQTGYDYYFGRNGKSKDYVKARDFFQQAADRGSVAALNRLGLLYHYGGKGVAKDAVKAKDYYEQAAALGNTDALNNLGDLYYHGPLGPDYAAALDYYVRAADAGNFYAQYSLGVMYENGHGVTADLARALDYYRQAAAVGYSKAVAKARELDAP